MYGAKECLMYVRKFEIHNLNEQDQHGNIPLYYLIANYSDNTLRNKEMFLWLCKGVNIEVTCDDGETLKSKMKKWHIDLHTKYGNASLIDRIQNLEQNLV